MSVNDQTIKMLLKHDILKSIILNNNDYIQQTIRKNLEKYVQPNLVPRVLEKLDKCCDDAQTDFIMNLVKYYIAYIGTERPNVTAICFAVLLFYYHSDLLELGTTDLVDSRDPRFKLLPIYNEIQKFYIDIVTGDGKGARFVRRSILGFLDLPDDLSGNTFETVSVPIPNYDEVRRKIERNEQSARFWKNVGRKRPASEMAEDTWTGGIRRRKTKNHKTRGHKRRTNIKVTKSRKRT